METVYFNELPSTQTYLIEQLKSNRYSAPIVVVAQRQTHGIGSRENYWEGGEGNLFFSFAVDIEALPEDLMLNSVSIYFSYIMKEILAEYSEDIWLKWPNDLYSFKYKVGGVITKKLDRVLVCGMGINLQKNSNGYKALNLDIEANFLLKKYLEALEAYPSWKQVFSKYAIEFERSKKFFTHVKGESKSLENAILSNDGSLILDNKRVYSLR